MKKGQDLVAEFPGLLVIHQKIPGREVGRHEHQEHEFFMPLQGEITLTFSDRSVTGGPGRMVYAPPAQEHRFSSSALGEGERVILLVDKAHWSDQGGDRHSARVLPAGSLVRELAFYLLLNQKSKGAKHFVSALTSALIEQMAVAGGVSGALGSIVHLSGKVQDPRVRAAMESLAELPDQPTIQKIAKQSGLSLRNLNRLFLKDVGLTPKSYATLLKIERAKEILRSSRMTVTDIANEVGYQSLSKFISTFQKHTGQLPSEFRRASVAGESTD